MSYLIDARLEQGAPSLTLVDAETGQACFHWRGDNEKAWHGLFKRLMLLSCVDRLQLIQSMDSSVFAQECINCNMCVVEDERSYESTPVLSSNMEDTNNESDME